MSRALLRSRVFRAITELPLHELQWRVRYTWIGVRRTGWGVAEWWDLSGGDYEQFHEMGTPADAVQEELHAMAASQ